MMEEHGEWVLPRSVSHDRDGRPARRQAAHDENGDRTKQWTSHNPRQLSSVGCPAFFSVSGLITLKLKATETISAKGDARARKVRARNKVSGRVTDIRKGPAMASISVDAGELKLTTAMTSQAADDLQLKQGDRVMTLFKDTEVMRQKA
jgi:molybdopterin-binding protein